MKKSLLIIIVFFASNIACFWEDVKVVRVIDGDTFVIETGEKVRLTWINAPEISDIFWQESKYHLDGLIGWKTVNLEKDMLTDDKDIYLRLLRRVLIDDVDVNKMMISDGYAFAYLKYNFSRKDEYRETQELSNSSNLGMWNNDKINSNTSSNVEKRWSSLNITKYSFIFILISILLSLGIYFSFKKS